MNIHGGEKFSPPVKTFKGSLGAKSTTPEPSHTRHTHTHQPVSPEGKDPKTKRSRRKIKSSGGKRVDLRSV